MIGLCRNSCQGKQKEETPRLFYSVPIMYLHFEQNLSVISVSFAGININVFPEVSLAMNLCRSYGLCWSL